MIALALALAFGIAVSGALAWRWLSLRYPPIPQLDLDGDVRATLARTAEKVEAHESRIQALSLAAGLRTQRESRV